jgi:acyl carrier protein
MKSQTEILKEVEQIFIEVFNDEGLVITPSTKADDVKGWDSLTHMSLIAQIEAHFETEFSFSEVMHFNNVGDMVETLEKKLN